MRFIFYFLGSIAAIMITISSGWSISFLVQRQLELRGWFQEEDASAAPGAPEREFEQADPLEVQTFSQWVLTDPENEEYSRETTFSIAPIYLGIKGVDPQVERRRRRFDSDAWSRRPNGLLERKCPDRYVSDFLVRDHRLNRTSSLFGAARLVATRFAVLEKDRREGGALYLFVETVREDTDADGRLTCNDFRDLSVYDFATGELAPLELDGGEPVWGVEHFRRPRYGDAFFIGVGVDENGDGLHDRTREPVRIGLFNEETMSIDILEADGSAAADGAE